MKLLLLLVTVMIAGCGTHVASSPERPAPPESLEFAGVPWHSSSEEAADTFEAAGLEAAGENRHGDLLFTGEIASQHVDIVARLAEDQLVKVGIYFRQCPPSGFSAVRGALAEAHGGVTPVYTGHYLSGMRSAGLESVVTWVVPDHEVEPAVPETLHQFEHVAALRFSDATCLIHYVTPEWGIEKHRRDTAGTDLFR